MTRLLPEPDLPALLSGGLPPGVYHWRPETHPAAQALLLATAHGWRTGEVDLTGATGTDDLLDRCARALHFPAWFDYTWDGLADCLVDLSWLGPSRGTLVLVRGWYVFLAAAPDAADAAGDVLEEAAEGSASRALPLAVLLS